jgi:hypothetical protein
MSYHSLSILPILLPTFRISREIIIVIVIVIIIIVMIFSIPNSTCEYRVTDQVDVVGIGDKPPRRVWVTEIPVSGQHVYEEVDKEVD